MLEEHGVVVAVRGEFAWVETERRSTCDACSMNKGCGTATLSRALGRRRTQVRVLNGLQAAVGDRVVVGLQEDALLRGSLAVYLLPLLMMLLFALVGQGVFRGAGSEPASVLSGLLGLALGFGWVALFSRGIIRDPRYQPSLLRRTL